MRKSLVPTIARVLLLAVAVSLQPAAADLYIGAGAYRSEAQFDNLDDSDTTTAVFVGYTFIDTIVLLSAELGKYDLGSYRDGGDEIDADAVTLAAVVGLGIGPFIELYAKTGIASTDISINGLSEDGDESFSGVGISFDLLDTLDFYGEYIDFDTDIDSNMVGVGIRLTF